MRKWTNIVSFILIIIRAHAVLPSCTPASGFPLGSGGTLGAVEYTCLDVNGGGTKMVVGGGCTDSTVCGVSGGRPIIELIDPTTRLFTWSRYFPTDASIPHKNVAAIKFNSDTTKIHAALQATSASTALTFATLNIDGTLFEVKSISSIKDVDFKPHGLLADGSDNFIAIFKYTEFSILYATPFA